MKTMTLKELRIYLSGIRAAMLREAGGGNDRCAQSL